MNTYGLYYYYPNSSTGDIIIDNLVFSDHETTYTFVEILGEELSYDEDTEMDDLPETNVYISNIYSSDGSYFADNMFETQYVRGNVTFRNVLIQDTSFGQSMVEFWDECHWSNESLAFYRPSIPTQYGKTVVVDNISVYDCDGGDGLIHVWNFVNHSFTNVIVSS